MKTNNILLIIGAIILIVIFGKNMGLFAIFPYVDNYDIYVENSTNHYLFKSSSYYDNCRWDNWDNAWDGNWYTYSLLNVDIDNNAESGVCKAWWIEEFPAYEGIPTRLAIYLWGNDGGDEKEYYDIPSVCINGHTNIKVMTMLHTKFEDYGSADYGGFAHVFCCELTNNQCNLDYSTALADWDNEGSNWYDMGTIGIKIGNSDDAAAQEMGMNYQSQCTDDAICALDEYCENYACKTLTCAIGYHPENHQCAEDAPSSEYQEIPFTSTNPSFHLNVGDSTTTKVTITNLNNMVPGNTYNILFDVTGSTTDDYLKKIYTYRQIKNG